MISDPQKYSAHGGPEVFLDTVQHRLVKHQPVAHALRLASASVVNEIVALANLQVDLWEANSLCSKDYISAWRDLLKDPAAAASVLEERSSSAAALRQNSPFVATIRKFQSLAHAT